MFARSWSAVALMMMSARTPGSIRSIAVATPRFARDMACRALSAVDGSLMAVWARLAPSATDWRGGRGRRPLGELFALRDDDRGLLDGDRRWGRDPVQDEGVGHLLDEVEDVVQAADQRMDFLAVEGRDKRRLQPVRALVAGAVP